MPVDKAKEKEIEDQCRALIHMAKFPQAVKIMEEYRTPLQDFMGGFGQLHLDRELSAIYKMYENIPEQLRTLSAEFYIPAREELAYMFLRGTNTIRKFMKKPTNIPGMTVGVAMIIMMNRAYQLVDIDDWKKKNISGVEIVDSKNDLCPECRKLCGKYFWNDTIPALPNPKCSKTERPCLPLMIAVVGSEQKSKKKGFFGLF